MKTELENIELINGLLKEAKDNFTGEWTDTHKSRMNQIFKYIELLNYNTGKRYVIDRDTNKLVVEK